ncbi:hypothetical protein F1645_08590 [Novacetimonas hansenii]
MKLFSKSFRRRCLFEKRQHPKTFIFYQWVVFKQFLRWRFMDLRNSETPAWSCMVTAARPALRLPRSVVVRPALRTVRTGMSG